MLAGVVGTGQGLDGRMPPSSSQSRTIFVVAARVNIRGLGAARVTLVEDLRRYEAIAPVSPLTALDAVAEARS
jgi:hypothetical protein